MADCRRGGKVQLKGDGVALGIVVLIIALGVFSAATWKLLNDSIRNNELHNDGETRNMIARYLEDRKRVMKACITIISCGCTSVKHFVEALCESCSTPYWLTHLSNVLFVIPIIANGWIFLFYSNRFREVCRTIVGVSSSVDVE